MADNPTVLLETSSGDILIELFPDKAPQTVANFLQYVDDGFYENTIFHRVIPGFMIQGGGMGARMDEKDTREPVQNEADNGLKNERGTLAMARTRDPHSATAQFFINLVVQRLSGPQPAHARRLGLLCVRQSHRRHGRGGQDRQGQDQEHGHARECARGHGADHRREPL